MINEIYEQVRYSGGAPLSDSDARLYQQFIPAYGAHGRFVRDQQLHQRVLWSTRQSGFHSAARSIRHIVFTLLSVAFAAHSAQRRILPGIFYFPLSRASKLTIGKRKKLTL